MAQGRNMDLFEDAEPRGNTPEFSVTEITGGIKTTIESEFGHVRVRGEVGRVVIARTGHVYFDLKDDRNVLAAVSWKGQAAKFTHMPEEGMEVVATGRMTVYGPQSKYQLNVEDVVPAGAGALMAMLEKRRVALAAEGLFDPERKQPLPFLPEVIGVVTSPTGAVIRDILHRLRDRFPRRVLVWPVAVQGQQCAPQVAAAINGFNRLAKGGPVPRPDLIIVARGGGSLEDLWGFNEEIVVRAAAASEIPLISAVGHETDTTLIDHASDYRAPTPTAAAERAVPVRLELLSWVGQQASRLGNATGQTISGRRQRLFDLGRALPRPDALLDRPRQTLDHLSERLPTALGGAVARKRLVLSRAAGALRPSALRARVDRQAEATARLGARLVPALGRAVRDSGLSLERQARGLQPHKLQQAIDRGRERHGALAARLAAVADRQQTDRRTKLAGLDRLRQTLGYEATLERGFAVVWSEGDVITTSAAAKSAAALEIQFADGRVAVGGKPAGKTKKPSGGDQGSLF